MPKFGIITTDVGDKNIIIQSCNKRSGADIAEARNEKGKVIGFFPYSVNETYDIRGLLNADTTQSKAGQKLTIGGKDFIIETTDQSETNTGWVEVSFTAKTADSAEIYTETN